MPWKSKEAQAAYNKQRRSDNHAHVRLIEKNSRAKNPHRTLMNRWRSNAHEYGREFTITEDDLTWPTHCPIFGVLLDYNVGGRQRSWNTPSLDRWDNTKDYIAGNCFIISWRANVAKSDLTANQLVALATYAVSKPAT